MTTTDIEKAEPEAPGTDIVPADGGDGGFTPAHSALLEPDPNPRAEALRTRLLLPLLLPIVSAAGIAFFAINLSRSFLAGGKIGALVVVSVMMMTILLGAALISAAPNLSTGSLAVIVAVLLGTVGAAGLVTLGASENKHGGGHEVGFVPPKGPPVATIDIDALPTLKFQATDFPTISGINQINYLDKGGTHTLLFDEPELRGFELAVNGDGDDSGKVELGTGVYTVYCSIPGHRAAGMEATITVGAP